MWYPGSGVVLDCTIPDLCHLSYYKISLIFDMSVGKTSKSLQWTMTLHLDGWLRMGLLPPPPREFCRHILSCRELKAESFKRCLHSVLRGVSL